MKSRGFTLIEILIALGIIGLIAGISVPTYKVVVENSNTNTCALNREILSEAESTFFLVEGRHSSGAQELLDFGYLKTAHECPEGHAYIWKKIEGTDHNYLLIAMCPKHNLLEMETSYGNIIMSTKYLDMYDSGALLSKLSELKYVPDYSANSVKVQLASGTQIETDDLGSATVKFIDGSVRYIENIYNSWQYLKSDFNYSQDRMEYSGDYMYVGYGFAGEGKYEHNYLDYEYDHDHETGSYYYKGVSNYYGTYSGASLNTNYGYISEGTYQTNEPYRFSYAYDVEDDGSYSGYSEYSNNVSGQYNYGFNLKGMKYKFAYALDHTYVYSYDTNFSYNASSKNYKSKTHGKYAYSYDYDFGNGRTGLHDNSYTYTGDYEYNRATGRYSATYTYKYENGHRITYSYSYNPVTGKYTYKYKKH